MKKLDWPLIWSDFADAYKKAIKRDRCKCCNSRMTNEPSWEDQEKMIEKIVNKHLKGVRCS